jgi:hypothetical protein
MRVKCLSNDASSIGPAEFGLYYGTGTVWESLEVGREYEVYGIYLFNRGLKLLIDAIGNFPSWYPAPLFEVVEPTLPPHWQIAFYPGMYASSGHKPAMQFVMGYPALTQSDHLLALQDRRRDALELFERESSSHL